MSAYAIPLMFVALIFVGWLLVHWRFHVSATPLASLAEFQQLLVQGRPTIIQFHAPL